MRQYKVEFIYLDGSVGFTHVEAHNIMNAAVKGYEFVTQLPLDAVVTSVREVN